MKNINRFFLIILVVLFALGMASLFFSIKHLYKDKPSPEVAPMKYEPPQVDEEDMPSHSSEKTVSPKLVLEEAAAPEPQEKVVSIEPPTKADEKVNSSEEPSDVSSLENSKPSETMPSIPDKRKSWSEVGDQLIELEQQRENSINSLSTKVNQPDGK